MELAYHWKEVLPRCGAVVSARVWTLQRKPTFSHNSHPSPKKEMQLVRCVWVLLTGNALGLVGLRVCLPKGVEALEVSPYKESRGCHGTVVRQATVGDGQHE